MAIVNNKARGNLEDFVSRQFAEHDFVAILLPLLCQKGIRKIDEDELEEKLYCYYQNEEFAELFQDIVPARGSIVEKLNIYDGLYREKYFSGNLWFDQLHSNILNLTYDKDIDLSWYERGLSEDGKIKIRQIAQELATRFKAESHSKIKLRIFNFDPNRLYSLVHGKHIGNLLSFELITDGDISSIEYPNTRGMEHLFYNSPINPHECVQLKDNKVAHVILQNATYAIKQGLCDGNIRYSDINTHILDEEKLEKIVAIANHKYEKDECALTSEAPYVRKIVLK